MSKAALIEAVVAVQAAMTPVPKTKEATVTKKDGTFAYKFTFADLDDVMAMLRPLIAEHKIAVTQEGVFADGQWQLRTTLRHPEAPDEEISGYTPVVWKGDCQQYGIGQTYARRYGIAAIFGVVTDEDTSRGAGDPTEKETEGAQGAGRAAQQGAGDRNTGEGAQGGERRSSGARQAKTPKVAAVERDLRKAKGAGFDTAGLVATWAGEAGLAVDKNLFDRLTDEQAQALQIRLHQAAPEIFPPAPDGQGDLGV